MLSAADEKGWFRFQRLYDVARSVLRTEDDVRRLVREAAEDDVRDGGRWLEIQVDPSGYGARFGGITAFTDLVLDAVREASAATGLGMARGDRRQPHPAPARRPHPGPARRPVRRPRRGRLRALQRRAARQHRRLRGARSTSPSAPGCCWCRTAASCAGPSTSGSASTPCTPHRLGHGVRAAEDPALLDRIVAAGVALEVCPVSNVALGVYSDLTSVPLPTLLAAGATVALGADDPLLFGSRLAGQYATMRAAHELDDAQLAELARMSVRASRAPEDVRAATSRGHRRVAGRRRLTGCRHDDRPAEPVRQQDPRRRSPTPPTTPAVRRAPQPPPAVRQQQPYQPAALRQPAYGQPALRQPYATAARAPSTRRRRRRWCSA